MKTWHKVVAGLGGLILLLTVVFLWWLRMAHQPSNPADHEVRTLTLNGHTIQAEVVVTPADQQEGLSDRSSMPRDHGMLFEMGERNIWPFWMIRMHFPLDMVWIDGDRVVEIAPNQPAPGFLAVPVTHTPTAQADQVLELDAGVANELNLKVGDEVGGL